MSKTIERVLLDEEFISETDDSVIICRCEEITKGEIRKAVYDGMRNMNEVKRYLRVGMGLCQGQTCTKLVKSIIAKELGINPGEIEVPIPRSPTRPVSMQTYANDGINK
ncbi:(2Fe-2S)-binding protein [Clostridium sp. BJN0013]|mgnify:CR=1 FL=1|uniref:(2Fe-2S)-binding protein n=1 Tax=Clostridium sp. BJN0013 TaxID=3236840 RepID=UPI0034C5EB8E